MGLHARLIEYSIGRRVSSDKGCGYLSYLETVMNALYSYNGYFLSHTYIPLHYSVSVAKYKKQHSVLAANLLVKVFYSIYVAQHLLLYKYGDGPFIPHFFVSLMPVCTLLSFWLCSLILTLILLHQETHTLLSLMDIAYRYVSRID